jgi:prepilin-type N-terminal cleavage/methylation domain-containing protein
MVDFARALFRKCRSQGGFTLPELTVGMAVTLIVAAAAMTLVVVFGHQVRNQEDRGTSLDSARTGLAKMVREVRQAGQIVPVPANEALAFDAWVPVTLTDGTTAVHRVRFDCSTPADLGRKCTRQDLDVAGSPAVQLVTAVVNDDVFAYGGADRTVGIKLEVDVEEAENPLAIEGAATARNCLSGTELVPCA